MELREYIKILKKYLFVIIMLASLGALAAYILTAQLPSGTQIQALYFIPAYEDPQLKTTSSVYYGQETARNFTDSAVAILESPDFAQLLTTPGRVSARKVTPQVIRITATSVDQAQANSLLNETISTFNENLNLKLTAVGREAQIVPQRPTKAISLVAGFLAGSIFALFIIGLKEYFKV